MEQGLKIGEVAQLIGVSGKTVRHYHKVGVLPEPPRTEAGYRLYGANDLLRLQRIRRLQALGLSLAQIRDLLEGVEQEGSLRKVLEALLAETEQQRQQLEERSERIRALLAQETPQVEPSSGDGPLVQLLQAELAHLGEGIDSALWEQERQLWSVFDEYHWPALNKQALQEAMQGIVAHAKANPAEYQALLAWGEVFMALGTMAADDPEIDRLAQRFVDSDALPFLEAIQGLGAPPPMPEALDDTLRELLTFQLTPAQQRFMERVQFYVKYG